MIKVNDVTNKLVNIAAAILVMCIIGYLVLKSLLFIIDDYLITTNRFEAEYACVYEHVAVGFERRHIQTGSGTCWIEDLDADFMNNYESGDNDEL